jgi:hypothetical protein
VPTPQFNVRVPERYHDLLRLIVERLRANQDGADALAEILTAVCRQPAVSADSLPSIADRRVDAIIDRLTALEERMNRFQADGASNDAAPAPVLHALQERLMIQSETSRRIMAFAEGINERLKALEHPAAQQAVTVTPEPRRSEPARPPATGKRRSPTIITDDIRRRVHDLRAAGWTRDAIAAELQIGGTTVTRIWHQPRPGESA